MSKKPFKDPSIGLNRIYTRQGDTGQTKLVGGQQVGKNDLRLECYGTVDELNSYVGMACLTATGLSAREPRLKPLADSLRRIQHELFNLGSVLATLPADVGPRQPRITDVEVARLEQEIDDANAELEPLRSFVLPGGSRLNTELHACRTVCRRAERLVATLGQQEAPAEAVKYLNRLSDAFFVWSRQANSLLKVGEVVWDPNLAASADTGNKPDKE